MPESKQPWLYRHGMKIIIGVVVVSSVTVIAITKKAQDDALVLYKNHLEDAFRNLADNNSAEVEAVVKIAEKLIK